MHLDTPSSALLGAVHVEEGAQSRRSGSATPTSRSSRSSIVHAWRILPFAVMIFIAGRASIPTEVEDAAEDRRRDGR